MTDNIRFKFPEIGINVAAFLNMALIFFRVKDKHLQEKYASYCGIVYCINRTENFTDF